MATEQTTTTQRDYLDTIATFVTRTEYDDLPEYVWMDTVGVILAGSLERENAALAQRLSVDGGSATILGQGFPRCGAMNAALANGTAGTFLELDEGHRPTGHPAIYIVPAVLALGESTGANGKQLIEALALAYEVNARLSSATRFNKGMHIHGCLGVMGAAVGAARILGYDALRVREAINVASCLNGATPILAALEGALVRNVYAGFSGQMGVLVTDLVESGFTGLSDGLSETYNKLIANSFDSERMVAGLGDDYQITTNYFKMHAACRHLHSPIDALQQAMKGRKLQPQEVKRVRVVGDSNVAMFGRNDPDNSLAAKFSVPFAIATSIARNNTGIEGFQQEAVEDPVTRDLAQRMSVEEDISFSRRLPHDHPALVEIVLNSGETLVGEGDNPIGDHSSPISYEELKYKFSNLTSAISPNCDVAQAMDLFMHLEEMPRASDLTEGLRALAS